MWSVTRWVEKTLLHGSQLTQHNSLTSTRGLLSKTSPDEKFLLNWQSALGSFSDLGLQKLTWKAESHALKNLLVQCRRDKGFTLFSFEAINAKGVKQGSLNSVSTEDVNSKAAWNDRDYMQSKMTTTKNQESSSALSCKLWHVFAVL